MRALLHKITVTEIRAAITLAAFGNWWADHAVNRLGKLSPDIPNDHPLKPGVNDQ